MLFEEALAAIRHDQGTMATLKSNLESYEFVALGVAAGRLVYIWTQNATNKRSTLYRCEAETSEPLLMPQHIMSDTWVLIPLPEAIHGK